MWDHASAGPPGVPAGAAVQSELPGCVFPLAVGGPGAACHVMGAEATASECWREGVVSRAYLFKPGGFGVCRSLSWRLSLTRWRVLGVSRPEAGQQPALSSSSCCCAQFLFLHVYSVVECACGGPSWSPPQPLVFSPHFSGGLASEKEACP